MNNKPEKVFKSGGIQVGIWMNEREKADGTKFTSASVVLQKSYVAEDGSWKQTHSLNTHELPRAIALLSQAYSFLVSGKEEEVKAEAKPEAKKSEKKQKKEATLV